MIRGKVSVIIAAYNCENTLEKCIDSMVNQTYKDIEIIICNDRSTDNTFKVMEELAAKDERIKLINNSTNLKAAATRNRCIEIAEGEFIAIQDADDYSALNRFERQIEILNKYKDISYVSTNMVRYDEDGIWGVFESKKERPVNKDFLSGLPYVHAATMFRTDAINSVQGYRVAKETTRCQDYDLFMRLHANLKYGINIKENLYYYNENRDAYSRRKYSNRIKEAIIRYKGYKALKLFPIGYIYVLKPLIIGLIPTRLQYYIKKKLKNK